MSFSSEEDEDEVQFDSKQLFSLHLTDSVHWPKFGVLILT